jgi:nitrate reductase NapE component
MENNTEQNQINHINNQPVQPSQNPQQEPIIQQPNPVGQPTQPLTSPSPAQTGSNVMPGQPPQNSESKNNIPSPRTGKGLKIFTIVLQVLLTILSLGFVGYFLSLRFSTYNGPGSEFLPLAIAGSFSYQSPMGIMTIAISLLGSIYFIFYMLKYKPSLFFKIALIISVLIVLLNIVVVVYASILLNTIRANIINSSNQLNQQLDQLLNSTGPTNTK